MSARNRIRVIGAILAMNAVLLSCAGPRNFALKDVDWSYYKKVGVAPFQNVSEDRAAGAKVTSAFVTELLITRAFEVAEPGNFARSFSETLRAQGTNDPSQVSATELKLIGDKTQVQGIVLGTVREYRMVRVGQEEYPLISIDLRLVDAPTGNLIWMASVTRRGGPKFPFVSIGETHTLGEMTEKVCTELAGSLASHL